MVLILAAITGLAAVTFELWPPPETDRGFHLRVITGHPAARDIRLTDYDGAPRALSDFRGRIVVLFFGYTRCPDACPTELFKFASALRQLGASGGGIRVVMVTLDPEADTPALLKGYVTGFDPRFLALTGTPAQISRAADDYHVVYHRERVGDTYTISHTTIIYIIDGQGRLRLEGNSSVRVEDLAADLRRLAREG